MLFSEKISNFAKEIIKDSSLIKQRDKTMKKSVSYRGWKIVLNKETNCYDLYTPDDADGYSAKDLVEFCTPEIEDIPTIEEAKEFIRNY